ncbi:MAG: lytic transglycosylase [Pimelobacter sp.]|nr:lytic transglycosylase [Pimelobacter sp.]
MGKQRTAAAAYLLSVGLTLTACAGPTTQRQTTPATPRSAQQPAAPGTAPADLLTRATRDGVRRPRTAAQAARQVLAAENAIRRPGTSAQHLATAGELAQVTYRVIGNRPTWDERVLAALPRRLHRVVERNVASRREFRSMHYTLSDTLPAWRIIEPEPAEDLLAHYREAEQRFGIDWEYLAAINLVETGMGRIRGLSVAGAQGPMQFIPATWAQYGRGDINDPRDAIMAAGRYLEARGFTEPGGIPGALYSYNNHPAYVRGVTQLARVMRAEPRAFLGYYHWQVYYLSSAGDVVLRPGYQSRTSIPVARFLRDNPEALSS